MNYGITGESCMLPGRYRCFGKPEVKVVLSAGQHFPASETGKPVYWILVSPMLPDTSDYRAMKDRMSRVNLAP